MTLPGWTREPLVHFLIAGFALFMLFGLRGEPVDPASRVISVGDEEQAQLALQFERTMGRAPTDAELDAQIERFVRDEVLYREALRLGLDQGDAVVRRRMVTKMDLSASAAAEAAEPDEATLRAFFEANPERYAGTNRVNFEQVYFAGEAAARAALVRGVDAEGGEPISLPPQMDSALPNEIEARFGEEFADAVAALDPGEDWSGPIRSGFGWHLVRVSARDNLEPDFETLAPRIANDWRSEQIAERKERAYQVLRDAYRVEIDR